MRHPCRKGRKGPLIKIYSREGNRYSYSYFRKLQKKDDNRSSIKESFSRENLSDGPERGFPFLKMTLKRDTPR